MAAPALLYIFSYFHRVAPVVVAGDLMQAFATRCRNVWAQTHPHA